MWYYTRENQQYGPVLLDELRNLVTSGQLAPGDLVRPENSVNWLAIRDTPEVAPAPVSELAYAGPSPNSRLREWTWIALLLVGSLTVLGELLISVNAVMFALAVSRFRPGPPGVIALIGVVTAAVPATLGITEILCSLKIRRKSSAATVVALIAVGLQFLPAAAMAVLSALGIAAGNAPSLPADLANLVFWGMGALVLGAVGLLLIGVLRERREDRGQPP